MMVNVLRCKWGVLCLGLILVVLAGCGSEGDITSPRLTVEVSDSPTNEKFLTLRGTVEEGAAVEVLVNPPPVSIAPVSTDGEEWTTVLELPDSPFTRYTVSVSAADQRGNRSTALLNFVFDNIAEITLEQIVSPVAAGSEQVLAGTIEPGSSLAVMVNDGPVENDRIFVNVNTWSAKLPPLAEGAQVIVTATDALGNSTAIIPEIVVSTIAIPLLIAADSPTNQTEQTVTVASPAGEARFEVHLQRGQAAPEEIPSADGSYSLSGLVPGKNVLTVTAAGEGLAETTAQVMIFVDQQRPLVSAVNRDIGGVEITFNEAVQGVDDSTFALKDGAGNSVNGQVTYDKTARIARFYPGDALAYGSPYRIELLGSVSISDSNYIADLAGNPLLPNSDNGVWSFVFILEAPGE